jgi:hypothetical protein
VAWAQVALLALQVDLACIPSYPKAVPRASRYHHHFPLSQFVFNSILTLEKQSVDVGGDDILKNFTTKESQMINGTVSWRGPRDCNPLLLQMFIEAMSQPGDLVLDCTSTTGNPLPSLRPNLYTLCHVILRFGYTKFLISFFFARASIIVCRNSNQHILALEEDEAIFKAILHPMI